MENSVLRNRGDTVAALLDNVQGFHVQERGVYLESLRLAMTRRNDEIIRLSKDRGVKLPEETLPTIVCASRNAWVNALPASFFARETVPGLSVLSDESAEHEMI